MVSVWRTIAIDACLERFRVRLVQLPPLESLPPGYPAHLGAAVRQNVELAGGQVRAEYRSIGPDDFLHSEVYCLVAIELVWRGIGLRRLLGQGPVPLAELVGADFEPLDLTSPSDDRQWSYLG